ncbi:MAG: arylsulfotransferase family protein [Pseudomonadota bacterium]|jgi:hypothetical protein
MTLSIPVAAASTNEESAVESAGNTSSEVWHFISEPYLEPQRVTINIIEPIANPGYAFMSPYATQGSTTGQPGALIMDNLGNPIYFRPVSSPHPYAMDFRVQIYRGKPVLTWWEGEISLSADGFIPPGAPTSGHFVIADRRYREIASVQPKGEGWVADFHEFLITPNNTFLFIAAKPVRADLSPYGGPSDGWVMDHSVQEIDPKTGRLVFFWDIMEHVPLSDSEQPVTTSADISWDAYHLNSISLFDNGDLLISARDTWAAYRVRRPTGEILWTLGGKKSDFTIASDARFYWQHHVEVRPDNRISMFDDGCCALLPTGPEPAEQESHGLLLAMDYEAKTATSVKQLYHTPNLSANSQGNMQALPDGHWFIGWGQQPYYSEFDAADNMIYDVQMPGTNNSYRVYRLDWEGRPWYRPSIAVRAGRDENVVYASWNGSTETAAWEVRAGKKRENLRVVKRVVRDGFETSTALPPNLGPYFQVVALGPGGRPLAKSRIVRR